MLAPARDADVALKGRLEGAALAALLLEGGRGGWSPAKGVGEQQLAPEMLAGCLRLLRSNSFATMHTLQWLPCSGAAAAMVLLQAMWVRLRHLYLGGRRADAAAGWPAPLPSSPPGAGSSA